MALSSGQAGTADPIEADYLTGGSDDASVLIHMHLDAVDGIARDAVEGLNSAPRRGVEVGGLLLGHVAPGERPRIWIDRYQRLECKHRFGPRFVLDEEDFSALEKAATAIYQSSGLSIVGFYRSIIRSGFELEESDFDLIGRYFSDSTDLILLIKPENIADISAQFFARGPSGEVRPSGEPFPFRGRVVGSLVGELSGDPAAAHPAVGMSGAEVGNDAQTPVARNGDRTEPAEDPGERSDSRGPEAAPKPAVPREGFRRLVPDFAPLEEQRPPARAFMSERLEGEARPALSPRGDDESSLKGSPMRRWWPLLAAILLVAGAVWLLVPHPEHRDRPSGTAPSEAVAPEPGLSIRPLGLYVDSSGPAWRVSWNPAATALRGALFVRDGDDQNRIDLSPEALQSGAYQYQPKGQDVTFRLEVTDKSGHLSAESFRLLKTPAATARPAPPPNAVTTIKTVRARATHKVPPVIPAGIRPRIRTPIPIDVRVHIDTRGHVTEAAPTVKQHSGLESYLAERAVAAAKQWRFEPAREDGIPVPGADTIHFVFER